MPEDCTTDGDLAQLPAAVAKVATNITGLDEIPNGGIPEGAMTSRCELCCFEVKP